ncbi:MAG: EAL domain-containing protein [Clostridia bacterium]|nr:EAL domain-containing protein [Clostridia bacterium]
MPTTTTSSAIKGSGFRGGPYGIDTRGILFHSIAVAMLLSAVGWFAAVVTMHRMDQQVKRSLAIRAAGAASLLDSKRAADLLDPSSPEYGSSLALIGARLRALRNASPDAHLIYIARVEQGRMYMLVDSEPEASSSHSPPGQALSVLSPDAMALISGGRCAVLGPIHDRWGVWVTGLSPIASTTTGDAYAVLALDINAANWPRRLRGPWSIPLLLALFTGALAATLILMRNRQSVQQARWLSTHDHLTGLPNRSVLSECIEAAIEEAKRGKPSTLVLIDIDNFKIVNDTLSHLAGDEVLIRVARCIRGMIRETDLVARLGGDEFVVLLQGVPVQSALTTAERIRESVEDLKMEIDGATVDVTLSVGLTQIDGLCDQRGITLSADAALYHAKDNGKNRVTYPGAGDEAGHGRPNVYDRVSMIKDALRDDRFLLQFQPIVSAGCGPGMRSAKPEGIRWYEALVRIVCPSRGMVLPGEFIPWAERFGLITQIDRWVVNAALQVLANRDSIGLFINLSVRSISSASFLTHVEEAVAASGVAPCRIGFEITETTALGDVDEAREWIQRLRALGCLFAVDDFGAGYSTMSVLSSLPVDIVKIDGSVIRAVGSEPAHRLIVEAINSVAHSIGARTVAECVEDAESLAALDQMGVDYVQGYYIARPASLEAHANEPTGTLATV